MRLTNPLRAILLATSALVALRLVPALANPLGGQVVGGTAIVQGTGTPNVTVTQSSQNSVINWNTFNIGAGEKTQFIQPNSSATVLNRVTGDPNPSQIFGTLTANGRVFIINPNGVLIGNGAVINTAGFLATPHDIANSDFMAGRYNFNIPGRPDASIVNLGTITASNGGFAALVAPGVRNSGVITANFGKVALASGNGFSLDLYGDQLIKLGVSDSIAASVKDAATGLSLKSMVENDGKLKANGGQIALTAVSARRVVDSVINNSGVIEARSIGLRDGKIVLGGPTASAKVAGLPTQTVKVSGTLDVSSKRSKGGKVEIVGENLVIVDAHIDASGATGGGKVLIGGDIGGGKGSSLVTASLEPYAIPTATTVSIDGGTVIDASARSSGNGGKVVVWSDQATTFLGTIYARGGANSGNGGFVETSGHSLDFAGARVNTSALKGKAGQWLLDPFDLTINGAAAATISGSLVTTDVLIETTASGTSAPPGTQTSGGGDIIVDAAINWATTHSLTLSAYRDVVVTANGSITLNGGGKFVMRADNTGTGAGIGSARGMARFLGGGGQVAASNNSSVSIYYNPANYSTPLGYSGDVTLASGSTLKSYMLVSTPTDLQNVSTNFGGTYALGRDIDVTPGNGFTGFGTGLTFTGLFDGNGGIGGNRTISGLTLSGNSSQSPVALFGFIDTGATVRNLNLANVNLTANPGGISPGLFIAPLAGENRGTIDNVHVLSGTITTSAPRNGVGAGGLVGQNRGTISNSSSAVNITISGSSTLSQLNYAGGLVAANLGTIDSSSASGTIISGNNGYAGGLAGENGLSGSGGGSGTITNSFATGAVSGGSLAGGLVGFNMDAGTITNSYATGNVAGTGVVVNNDNCGLSGSCQSVDAGGLVGMNSGLISGSGTFPAYTTYATGNVTVSSRGAAGGLVGYNQGTISSTYHSSGTVTGAAGTNNSQDTILGGLVGTNQGEVLSSYATGNVGSNVDNLLIGGLVGDNSGRISNSSFAGNVTAGNGSQAGGLAGTSDPSDCTGCGGQGIAFNNDGKISNSTSSGSVTVGSGSLAGGLSGSAGTIINSQSSSTVTGGGDSILGGFVAVNSFNGHIFYQTSTAGSAPSATGSVTSQGPNSWIGGFVGLNVGIIENSTGSGTVNGTSDSGIGGFAGINVGLIDPSSAGGTINVSGSGNVIGGFAGINFGTLDQVSASGSANFPAGNIFGTLVGANAQFVNFTQGLLPYSSFPVGTLTNSTGPNPVVGVTFPDTLPKYPAPIYGCDNTICEIARTGILSSKGSQGPDNVPGHIVAPPVVYVPQVPPDNVTPLPILVALTTSTAGAPSGTPRYSSRPGQPGFSPPPLQQRLGPDGLVPSGMPPLDETRFLQNQLLMRLNTDALSDALRQILQQLGIGVVATDSLGMLGGSLVRLELPPGMTVRQALAVLEANRLVPAISPNYMFRVTQADGATTAGNSAQYMLDRLAITKTHLLATGKGVTVAVIDSEVDKQHSELQGRISEEFDTLAVKETPHSHGTAMAGAIGSRNRLLGVAPGARIIAVRAFGKSNNTAEGTTVSILKGLEWAMSQGAKVVNMSFAGPRDPALERALKLAYDRGVILVAAAGNAGPKSPPLYPAADPHVIAVTATDVRDRGFRGANQGPQVSVAAPGVDVLAPAPEDSYQMSTGTSIATAHVSGVVALMLERDPRLTPTDVRRILEGTATDLGQKGKDAQFGWGLVNPLKALEAVAIRLKSSDASSKDR